MKVCSDWLVQRAGRCLAMHRAYRAACKRWRNTETAIARPKSFVEHVSACRLFVPSPPELTPIPGLHTVWATCLQPALERARNRALARWLPMDRHRHLASSRWGWTGWLPDCYKHLAKQCKATLSIWIAKHDLQPHPPAQLGTAGPGIDSTPTHPIGVLGVIPRPSAKPEPRAAPCPRRARLT